MRLVVGSESLLEREGLTRLLTDQAFDVVSRATSLEDILRKVGAHRPTVAIISLRLTDASLQAAREIRRRWPDIGVVILSEQIERELVSDLFGDGTGHLGYLLTHRLSDLAAFGASIREGGNGGSALDSTVVSLLLSRDERHDPLERLTAREREVLALVAAGLSNHGVGSELYLTERGVEKHMTSIYCKLEIEPAPSDHRRVLAALRYASRQP